MSTQKASSEAHALEIAMANFRAAHPSTEPVCSSVSASRTTTARGVESRARYSVQIDYMSQRYSRLEGCMVPAQRSACYYIDADQPNPRINTGTEILSR